MLSDIGDDVIATYYEPGGVDAVDSYEMRGIVPAATPTPAPTATPTPTPTPAVPIPAVHPAGLAAMGLLLAAVVFWRLRRPSGAVPE